MPDSRPDAGTADDYVVTVRLPALPRSVRPARALAASLGAEVGLDIDDLEDLRVAVQEAYALLLPIADTPIDMSVIPRADHLEIEFVASASAPLPAAARLARQLLEVLVADHDASTDGAVHRIWLRSHPPGVSNPA